MLHLARYPVKLCLPVPLKVIWRGRETTGKSKRQNHGRSQDFLQGFQWGSIKLKLATFFVMRVIFYYSHGTELLIFNI
jgi:hypothetical protein